MSETYNIEEAAETNEVAFDDADAGADDDDDDDYQHEDNERASSGTRTGCCYRTCVRIGCRCCARFPETWPRTFALLMGVVFPLFLLIAVSCVFGYGLARLEAPGEVETNDAILETRAALAFMSSFVTNLTERLPHICLSVYFAQNGLGDEILNQTIISNSNLTLTSGNNTHGSGKGGYSENLQLEEAIDMVFVRQYVSRFVNLDEEGIAVPFNDVEVVNTTDLMVYMNGCGVEALDLVSQYSFSEAVDTSLIGADLSFNWMSCDGENSTGFKGFLDNFFAPNRNQTILRPGYQEQIVVDQWRQNQQELYRQYFDQYYNIDGKRRFEARWLALQNSFEQATGHLTCDMNWYAGAWFWFTIMTTIGYGNTAPVTDGARAMVFTLGFLSILLFAAVLTKAGSIVTVITGDAIDRLKLTKINVPWVATLFWGALYYLWMCAIASYTVWWKENTLGEEMSYRDAYWFSFVSTTTVGFGDFFLEHEVIRRRDLLSWPLLFLTGFVLLSSFLNKLSEWIMSWIPQGRPSLEENLENTDVPCFPKLEETFVLNKKEKRKEELMKSVLRQSKYLEVDRDSKLDDEKDEDESRDREFISESTPVEAKGVDGNPWKGAVTNSKEFVDEAQAPQDAA